MINQKKHIQEQIQPASDLPAFKLVFDSNPAIMLLIETETGLILEANPAAIQYYGYPKSSLCGLSIDALITYPLELVAGEQNKASHKKLDETVFLHRLASGEIRNVEVLSSPLTSQGQQLQFWIVNDITERKQAQEALLNLQKNRAFDLFIENEEIAFQNEEKQIRAAELMIANQKLVFQNEENAKRAAELIIAQKQQIKVLKNELGNQSAAQITREAIFSADINGMIIAWNQGAEKIFGYTESEAIGLPVTQLIPTKHQGAHLDGMAHFRTNLEKSGDGIPVELEGCRKDGSLVQLEISLVSVQAGKDWFHTAIMHDISERKQAEKALRESNALLSAFMQYSPIYSFIKEVTPTSSRVLKVSENYLDMVGIPAADMLGKTMEELFPVELAAQMTADDWAVVSNGEVLRSEEEFNSHIYSSFKFPFSVGEKTLMAGYSLDITESKRIEQALAQTAARLSLAVRAGGVGTWEYDMINNRLTWDDQMYRLYGITAQDFSGAYDAWQQGLHPQDRERGDNEFQAAQRGEKEFNTEFRVVWPDGSVHYIRTQALIVRDQAGEPLSMVGTNWDITERRLLEQVLQNTNLDLQKSADQRDIALEELNIKKFELEMQNEELRQSQDLIDLTRARYFDLYDLAPVGYCTVSEKGLILEANLTAASLLGVTKTAMIKHPFSLFIARQHHDVYYLNRKKLLETGAPQTFELQMLKKDGSTFWARLETSDTLDTNADRMMRVVISEISALKAAEIQIKKRLKELSCLNNISQLAFDPGLTEQQLCQKVIERLIPALGYPEIAAAEISLNGKAYQSPNFSNSFNFRITAPILQADQECGQVTVCYTQPAAFQLPEEQNLLENIASTLGLWNQRKISDKDVKKLSQAIEQSPLSILITKPDGTIEYANSHFCDLTGYSLSEIIGKNPRILQTNFTSKEEYKLLWETLLAGQIWEGKFLNRKKDGSLFWEKATIAPVFDENRRIAHFLAVKENITAHKIMENDLRHSERHNRALLDAIPDLIFRIRRDGIILDCKANLNDHLIEHPDQLIGLSIYDNFDESTAADLRALINQTLRKSQVQTKIIDYKLKDGSHVFEVRLKICGDNEVVAIVRDISEQNRLAQMKTDFINRASHELRTPIATMLLMTDLLDEKMKGENADEYEYWDVLKSELQRERGLIEHLLNAGRLEGEQERTYFRSLKIDELIQQTVHNFDQAAREKGITLNVASIPVENTSPRLVQGDQNGLNLVLTNLIGNAIKFTPSGGKVSIQAQSVDGNLLISIIDSGIGIPSQDLPLLFSRFFRGSNAIDEEIQGTGLGLFIVRSILDQHNGRIQVTSEQGKGSRFDVWLPL